MKKALKYFCGNKWLIIGFYISIASLLFLQIYDFINQIHTYIIYDIFDDYGIFDYLTFAVNSTLSLFPYIIFAFFPLEKNKLTLIFTIILICCLIFNSLFSFDWKNISSNFYFPIFYIIFCLITIFTIFLIRAKNKKIIVLLAMIILPISNEILYNILFLLNNPDLNDPYINVDFSYFIEFFPWKFYLLYSICVALLWIPNIIYRKCPNCKFVNKKKHIYCGNCGEKI